MRLKLPRSLRFINGPPFANVRLTEFSVGRENETFILENGRLIDRLNHKLIRNFSNSSTIGIWNTIESIGLSSFFVCQSLLSSCFEMNSRLRRIESHAFSG
jgi:hypothetical protein